LPKYSSAARCEAGTTVVVFEPGSTIPRRFIRSTDARFAGAMFVRSVVAWRRLRLGSSLCNAGSGR
jgi:hypothetical protein